MVARPTGRSLATSWGDRRQDDETDRSHRDTHRRIDGLKIPGHVVYEVAGTLAPGNDQASRITPPADLAVSEVLLAVKTAPTGASIVVDVRVGGDSIFADKGRRATILAGETEGGGADILGDTTIRYGEYPLIDVAQVGSGVAGADLVVQIVGYLSPGAD